jgi:glycosyltransferase involved in cell wall biosynthesis
VPEVVVDGETGFVVEDIDGMVEAVSRIGAVDRGAVRARAERLYSDEAVVNGYLDVYSRLAASRA